MNRREILKTAGGIGATAAVGGAGLLASSSGALAASGELDINGTSLANDDGDVTRIGVALTHEVTWDGFDIPVEAVAYQDYIQKVDGSGSVVVSHNIYDNTENPVLLENWSGDGDSNGWGGADEYTAGPGTDSSVNADIDWTVISETPSEDGGTESPALASDFNVDNETDDSTKTLRLRYVKRVVFYTTTDTGGDPVSSRDGTTVYPMGLDDGTIDQVENRERFNVDVTNEPATASGGGSGSSSAE